MSRSSFIRKAPGILAAMAFAIAIGTAGEAVATPSSIHVYSFNATNNTGGASDNARFSVFGHALPALPYAPAWIPPAFSSTFWPAPTATFGLLWRHITWTGGAPMANGLTRWFHVRVQVIPPPDQPVAGTTFFSQAWFRWNAVSGTAGAPIPVGMKISSPPALFNASDSPYGGANVENLVVRNIKFAQSPYEIRVDSLNLDNPTVQARFAESADVTRPGPISVAPGGTHTFGDMHPGILDPTPGGRTILMQGTTEDWNGAQHTFMVQIVQPLYLPGRSPIGLMILALLLAALGTVFLARSRRLGSRLA